MHPNVRVYYFAAVIIFDDHMASLRTTEPRINSTRIRVSSCASFVHDLGIRKSKDSSFQTPKFNKPPKLSTRAFRYELRQGSSNSFLELPSMKNARTKSFIDGVMH